VEQDGLLEMKVDLRVPEISFNNVGSKDSRTYKLPEKFKYSKENPVFVFATMALKNMSVKVI